MGEGRQSSLEIEGRGEPEEIIRKLPLSTFLDLLLWTSLFGLPFTFLAILLSIVGVVGVLDDMANAAASGNVQPPPTKALNGAPPAAQPQVNGDAIAAAAGAAAAAAAEPAVAAPAVAPSAVPSAANAAEPAAAPVAPKVPAEPAVPAKEVREPASGAESPVGEAGDATEAKKDAKKDDSKKDGAAAASETTDADDKKEDSDKEAEDNAKNLLEGLDVFPSVFWWDVPSPGTMTLAALMKIGLVYSFVCTLKTIHETLLSTPLVKLFYGFWFYLWYYLIYVSLSVVAFNFHAFNFMVKLFPIAFVRSVVSFLETNAEKLLHWMDCNIAFKIKDFIREHPRSQENAYELIDDLMHWILDKICKKVHPGCKVSRAELVKSGRSGLEKGSLEVNHREEAKEAEKTGEAQPKQQPKQHPEQPKEQPQVPKVQQLQQLVPQQQQLQQAS